MFHFKRHNLIFLHKNRPNAGLMYHQRSFIWTKCFVAKPKPGGTSTYAAKYFELSHNSFRAILIRLFLFLFLINTIKVYSILLIIRTVRRASSAVHSYVLPNWHTYGTYNRKDRVVRLFFMAKSTFGSLCKICVAYHFYN